MTSLKFGWNLFVAQKWQFQLRSWHHLLPSGLRVTSFMKVSWPFEWASTVTSLNIKMSCSSIFWLKFDNIIISGKLFYKTEKENIVHQMAKLSRNIWNSGRSDIHRGMRSPLFSATFSHEFLDVGADSWMSYGWWCFQARTDSSSCYGRLWYFSAWQ